MIYKTCFIAFWKNEVMLPHPVNPIYHMNLVHPRIMAKILLPPYPLVFSKEIFSWSPWF